MTEMNVALACYEYPGITTNSGGGGQMARYLRHELVNLGHDVTLVTDRADGHHMTYPARTYRRTKRVIERDNPDVIHGLFSLPTSLLLPRIATITDTPLVVSVLGADVYDPTRYDGLRPITDRINGYIFDRASTVVAPSTDMQTRLKKKHGYDADVISLGINPDDWVWRPKSLTEPLSVITVSRLVSRKNHRMAYEALKELRADGVDVRWRIVGTGPLEHDLRQLTGMDSWVSMPGYVDNLQSEYDWADVFFLPTHHESFGLVFLEALATGTPVITSDCGGQTDIASDTDAVKTVRTDQSRVEQQQGYVAAFNELVEQYDATQRATKNVVADKYSTGRMTQEYLRTYRRVA